MKIDRVILSSNFNPTYYHFWNPLAKVYKEKFGIKPTLIWFGTEGELKQAEIDTTLGDIHFVTPHPEYHTAWQTTWGLFYFTKYYPDDVCLIIGIDQLPLSNMFFDMVKPYDNNTYCMLIADAYRPNHWTTTASPSSYHIAKGSVFNAVHKFESTFYEEINKIGKSGIDGFWETTEGRWGIDETWSSKNLRETSNPIVSIDNFTLLCERRVECERHKETYYDKNLMRQGWYSESHLCRPYTNHVNYINEMINNIPCYTQAQ